jgi:ABC-type transport system involved in cytochrome c biogenesis permease component
MTFLPIVERELRVASRRAGTYWVRTGVALAVIAIGSFMYLTSQRQSSAELGSMMFVALAAIAGLFCLSAGARSTSDCLSEEKRDGTLGLLFLTDLRGFDVVAGKLVAGSLGSFYGLIATLPMLAIPLLMGGVAINP